MDNSVDYKAICRQVSDLARRVGKHIHSLRQTENLHIEAKGAHDYVTQMDKLSERLIVAELEEILPQAGYITEEGTRSQTAKQYNWIVDPIDGTTNFIHSHPPYAISIALAENDKIVVGVVYEMGHDELFAAWLGGGAYLNGKRINVSLTAYQTSLIATGFPYSNFSRMDDYMHTLTDIMRDTAGIRRLGSAATDLAYVACGRYDAFFEYDLKPYDVAAGSLLVSEAGGHVYDFSGKNDYIFGREIAATNHTLCTDFMNVIMTNLGSKAQ